MFRHRRILVFFLVACFWWAQVGAQGKTFEQAVSLEPLGRLALETGRGTVRLSSWDQSTVEIRARIEAVPAADVGEASRSVDETTIEVRGRRRSIRIRSVYGAVPAHVHYEIRAPKEVDLDLTIDSSDTTVRGFEGRLFMQLTRSDLEATDLTGSVVLDLDRGALRAVDLSGSITLGLDRGRDVVLERLRGSIQLELDRTDATLRGVQIVGESLVAIDRGVLDLEFVQEQAVTIEAHIPDRSDLLNELPVMFRQNGRRLQGVLNGGGPLLRITADRSTIQLRTN